LLGSYAAMSSPLLNSIKALFSSYEVVRVLLRVKYNKMGNDYEI